MGARLELLEQAAAEAAHNIRWEAAGQPPVRQIQLPQVREAVRDPSGQDGPRQPRPWSVRACMATRSAARGGTFVGRR